LLRRRFPADVIRHAVWLCFRFSLGFRDAEELIGHRGVDVSYETIRRWSIRFGSLITRKSRKGRGSAGIEAQASNWPASGKQSDCELPPSDPMKRATAAGVQIPCLST